MPRSTFCFCCTLCLCAVMAGCISTHGIAPLEHPRTVSELASGAAIAAANSDAGWPAAQWWRAYGDGQLNRWIKQATVSSPSLAMAAARVRQARALAGLAESQESLQVDGDMALKRRGWPDDQFYGPGGLSDSHTWDNSASLGFSYPLDLWGQDRNRAEQFVDLAHRSAAQAQLARLELQSNIVRAYIQLSLHYAQRDIVLETLAQQEQIFELAQRRLKGGIGTQLDVSQARSPLSETRRQRQALDEAIALDDNQLSALAGKGPGQGARLLRPTLSLQHAIPLPAALPAQLLGHRPDVVASRWAVAAQARGIDVAHAGFYPNVNLAGSLGYMASGGGMLTFFSAQKFNYSAGPALSLPIFDGGRLRSELGQASAGYDIAITEYNQTLIHAFKDISDQLIRRRSLDAQQRSVGESIASAQQTYDIAMIAYTRGLTDYLSVLNAQTLLFQQQQIQQRLQAAQLTAHAALAVALGGGLLTDADSPLAGKTLPAKTPAWLEALHR
ncbi:efflux transporter outer membrane subunit [Pseudomonas tolaasii]|uniref:efflux transporter outer membrane subunit n=1 Tax=Pseudomonas tolaasii TaxID=29442 RepID=UPI0034CD45A6